MNTLARRGSVLAAAVLIGLCARTAGASGLGYEQSNFVSDIPGLADHTDSNLKNPWGFAYSATGPFWVSNEGSATSTVYNTAGATGLVVTIPGGHATGTAFINGLNFLPPMSSTAASFAFATLNGGIAAWNGGTIAPIVVANPNAVYTGLAVAGTLLYAADNKNNAVDVYDHLFTPTTVPGGFINPALPGGYSIYNIQNIGGKLYVTYENDALSKGIVAIFDANGVFEKQIDDPHFDEPWGITLAPAGFGDFAHALLVGNFGNGLINAFDASTFMFLGTIADPLGNPIVNDGLWALGFRAAASGFDPDALFFTAGINNQQNGLFGAIRVSDGSTTPPGGGPAVPEPASLTLVGLGITRVALRRRFR